MANIIGVSIGAVIGIPVGIAINHHMIALAERRSFQSELSGVKTLMLQLDVELKSHPLKLQRMTGFAQLYNNPQAPTVQTGAAPVGTIDVQGFFLQDSIGRQFLSSSEIARVGEQSVVPRVSSYYWSVENLNKLLQLYMQTAGSQDVAKNIAVMAATVVNTPNEVGYELEEAIKRVDAKRGLG